jgi:hypothetical protein
LYYFYTADDVERIELNGQSENFDVYCSLRDTEYTDSMLVWLERTLEFYKTAYEMEFNNRFNMVVLYDEQTGMDLTGYDFFNGGSGGLNISPHNFYDGIEGYPWLLAHEFGHVFNDYMYYDFPFGFYHEGMANFSGYKQYGVDWMESRWMINEVFNQYMNNHGRYPTLDEFVENPENNIDPYFFGLQFIRYLASFNSLVSIKEFFSSGMDFGVFDKTKSEIEEGYIEFLKALENDTHKNIYDASLFDVLYDLQEDKILIKSISGQEKINRIKIFDLIGRKLFDKKINNINIEINLNDFASHQVLILKINTNKGVYTEKIIK